KYGTICDGSYNLVKRINSWIQKHKKNFIVSLENKKCFQTNTKGMKLNLWQQEDILVCIYEGGLWAADGVSSAVFKTD
ncbi:hypothetical protein RUM43_002396, partial [Polyplax serrata]